jgi:hypothetical protein
MVHFEDAVNVTMGLPVVRTSVDHGTAYDIAGKREGERGEPAWPPWDGAGMAGFRSAGIRWRSTGSSCAARASTTSRTSTCEIPRDRLVVITGVSGRGNPPSPSTRFTPRGSAYVESLSAYARMFLEQMEKPDVDVIEGLSPAISIEQKSVGRNPRSTVGTVTEIYDYLRLLFASVGRVHCPSCGKEIRQQTARRS